MQNSALLGQEPSRKAELGIHLWSLKKAYRSHSRTNHRFWDFPTFFIFWMILPGIATRHRFFDCPRILPAHHDQSTERHSNIFSFLKAEKQFDFLGMFYDARRSHKGKGLVLWDHFSLQHASIRLNFVFGTFRWSQSDHYPKISCMLQESKLSWVYSFQGKLYHRFQRSWKAQIGYSAAADWVRRILFSSFSKWLWTFLISQSFFFFFPPPKNHPRPRSSTVFSGPSSPNSSENFHLLTAGNKSRCCWSISVWNFSLNLRFPNSQQSWMSFIINSSNRVALPHHHCFNKRCLDSTGSIIFGRKENEWEKPYYAMLSNATCASRGISGFKWEFG